jgi:transposase InsO family protein
VIVRLIRKIYVQQIIEEEIYLEKAHEEFLLEYVDKKRKRQARLLIDTLTNGCKATSRKKSVESMAAIRDLPKLDLQNKYGRRRSAITASEMLRFKGKQRSGVTGDPDG